MWTEIVKEIADFPTSILTGVDAAGYPFSVRCKPNPDFDTQVLRVELPKHFELQPCPAGLLCHKHDDLVNNQKSFLVRGRLEQDSQGWLFRPSKFIPGPGIGGVMAMINLLLTGRRNAKQYLEKRHLPRPVIAWDTVHAIWAEVHSQGQ